MENDKTNVTLPSERSMISSDRPSGSGVSEAVRSIIGAIVSCWPNAKFDKFDRANMIANAIDGLTGNQIRHGIRQLALMADEFPPSPGKFRAMCMTYRREEPEPHVSLPDDSPQAQANRERVKRMLHELAQSLRAQVVAQPNRVDTRKTRAEQEVCAHDWRPHHYLAGNYCTKCDLPEAELDAFVIRTTVERKS